MVRVRIRENLSTIQFRNSNRSGDEEHIQYSNVCNPEADVEVFWRVQFQDVVATAIFGDVYVIFT